jgi:hypothetical protein
MSGHITLVDMGNHMKVIRYPEGKRLLGRSRHRWEDNFKVDLK